MKRLFTAAILAGTLAMTGCASGLNSASQVNEKADTLASDLYVAIASSINAYEAGPTTTAAQKASAEAVKVKAWNDLQVIHAAYAAGQTVILTIMQADQAAASQVTGTTVPTPAH